jgi:predicted ArsR family transcriptional regulator
MLRISQPQQDIVKLLRRHGSLTVEDLSRALGVTSVAVRHHLDVLEAEGLLCSEIERRIPSPEAANRRGRPRRLFQLTEAADDLFPKNYSGLVQVILEHLETSGGSESVEEVFRARRLGIEADLRKRLEGEALAKRVAAVAELQDRSGYMADWEAREDGSFILREHNCAICKVARRFPQVCSNELQLIQNITEADVVREQHIAAGDSICSYRISPASFN